MTLESWAEKIAKDCIATHAHAFYVCATEHQTNLVLADATRQVTIELKAMLAEYHIKFE